MERKEVYENLDKERDYQDSKWHREIPDTEKSVSEWVTYMEHHLNKVKNEIYYLNENEALAELRKVTALGVRALEVHGCPERIF